MPIELVYGLDDLRRTLRLEPKLDLCDGSALPYFPPLNTEMCELVDLGLRLLKDLAPQLREVSVNFRWDAKGCTQRCHVPFPSRLSAMQPQCAKLIELQRIV